jgi:glycine cleavage system aminomethyltransferase T
MGYVESAFAEIGCEVQVVFRNSPKAARIVKRPFYTAPHWR